MDNRNWFGCGVAIMLAGCVGTPKEGAASGTTGDFATSDTSSTTSATSDASSSTSGGSTGGSASSVGSTGAPDPVIPEPGFWRWQSPTEVVDGCMLAATPFTYGLTQLSEVTSDAFVLQPWGGMLHPCSLATGDFSCEPLALQGFPAPAVTTAEFDGGFATPISGSMAFRNSADCAGPECDMIMMDTGVTFPCESTALTSGFLMQEVDLADEGCAAETGYKSTLTSEQAVVVVDNQSSEPRRLYWINFLGERADYGLLPAGESVVQWTFMTHAWVIADQQDECLGMYLPTQDAGRVVLQ